jgi:DivIVA domain-containing protein
VTCRPLVSGRGGGTDIDKLALACGPDIRVADDEGWSTRKNPAPTPTSTPETCSATTATNTTKKTRESGYARAVMSLFGRKRNRPIPIGWGSGLTPEDVRNVAFSKPRIGKRGYNEDEVDAFLDLVEAALRNPMGSALTPEAVRGVAFSKPPVGKRGYNEDEVDAFLDLVEEELRRR